MAGAYPSDALTFLLEQIEDQPANVDLRGLLLAGDVEITPPEPGAEGYVVYAPAIDIACLWGTPAPELIDDLAQRVKHGTQVVCESTLRPLVEPRLAALRAEPIYFYALPRGSSPFVPRPSEDHPVRIVEEEGEVALDHLPPELREEMVAALDRTFVAMTQVDGRAVAFSYPHHQTERFWDVSVDTLEAHRRQGHAARAFGAAYERLRREGKQPVWGSLASNAASNGLAKRMGFVEIAERAIVIAANPPRGSGG